MATGTGDGTMRGPVSVKPRRMKTVLAALLPLVLLAACETAPVQQASTTTAAPERPCRTGSNICGRASPTDVLTREDIRGADPLPGQRPMQ